MRTVFQWAVSNVPAMNLIMIAGMLIGYWGLTSLNRETFPNFDIDLISVSVVYPGATPEEVEEAICQKIEEEVRDIVGIKKVTSAASENVGSVSIELESNVDDKNRVLNEVDSAVGRISTFPELCERPDVRLLQIEETIIRVGILGPPDWSVEAQLKLRDVAEKIRNEILQLPDISRVDIVGSKDYQIDVEFDENTLRSYGLTLQDVAQIIARENHQQAGGTIRGRSQEILLRSDTKQDWGEGIAKLPLIGIEEGAVLTVGDLGNVRDEFVDTASSISIRTVIPNEVSDVKRTAEDSVLETEKMSPSAMPDYVSETGKDRIANDKKIRYRPDRPFLALNIQRNPEEDLFAMIDTIHAYVAQAKVPQGYELLTWGDRSTEVRERLAMLGENGVQGLLIVIVCLTLFLDMRLAVWVSLGIPFALLVTCAILMFMGQTLNMISSFALIMGLGIVVDDAIVIGENVFTHRQMGKSAREAAIDGIHEVFPSVWASVTTTVIAFAPLLFVMGTMGKIMFVLPVVMIGMLLVSLLEASTILPAHLSHRDNLLFRVLRNVFFIFYWIVPLFQLGAKFASGIMERFVFSVYIPALRCAMKYRMIFISACFSVMILAVGLFLGGIVQFVFFPKIDGTSIVCNVQFPNGTPESLTAHWAGVIEESYWRVAQRILEETGEQVSVHSIRTIGSNMAGRGHGGGMTGGDSSHMASVEIQLVDAEKRSIQSFEIIDRWRKETGTIPGALVLTFDSAFAGPGGSAIEFNVIAPAEHADELEAAVEKCKAKLASFDGLYDIHDDNLPGKWEFRPKVKDFAATQGVRQADVADVLRNAYYGAEVMRLQRGRHEVKLMVRYPEEDRRSLASFDELRVRINDVERPVGELADVEIRRGYSTINRIDQQRSITVTADADYAKVQPNRVIGVLQGSIQELDENGKAIPAFFTLLKEEFPHINIRWEGQREQEQESFDSMKTGFAVAMILMFILLTMQFGSYTQPFIILSIIPFAVVIVVLGHALFQMQMTFFSAFGLIALAGIVVNDSIVMVDFINSNVREKKMAVRQACLEAAQRRFRPIFLTTVTTVGGLMPICFETSFQAHMIIPMAFTMSVGTAGATVLTLFLVPVLYSLYDDFSTFIVRKFRLEHED